MESDGVFPDGEWDSFSSIFESDEANLLPRYLGNFRVQESYDAGLNSAPPTCFDPPASIGINGVNKSWCYSLDALTADFNLSKHDYRHSSYHSSQPNDISIFINMDSMGVRKTCSFPPSLTENLEENHHQAQCLRGDVGSHGYENIYYNLPTSMAINPSNEEEKLKRKLNGRVQNTHLAYNGKKKTRVSEHVQKSVKTVESPKSTFKSVKNSSKTSVQEDGNGGSDGQSTSSNSTDDENASHDTNGGATSASKTGEVLNSNGKTRAARGSATDPQSLYARKRRERINERLKILQKLVPNGTKVDISTMLEEAVHYVKFLQLQIKLLSSDDHWMYAPIAYNGMDIGLHQKISPLQFN